MWGNGMDTLYLNSQPTDTETHQHCFWIQWQKRHSLSRWLAQTRLWCAYRDYTAQWTHSLKIEFQCPDFSESFTENRLRHLGHIKRRWDNGTILDGRCAAVMFPVVMLCGKLASENARWHRDHVVSCTSIKVVQNDVFVIEFKSNIDVFQYLLHILFLFITLRMVLSRRLVSSSWSDSCTTAHWKCPVVCPGVF